MVKDVICNINFDHPNSIYNDGQTVFVNLDMHINKDITVQELYLLIRGFAECRWDRVGLVDKRHTVRHIKSLIFTKLDLISNKTLQKGNQKFDLKFTLPTPIPSSIEGHEQGVYYEIKYDVVVYLSRSWKQDLRFEKEFIVVSGYNLEMQPQLGMPTNFENHDLIAYIPRKGFIPGEKIPIKIRLKNFDDHRDILCTLNRKITHTYPSMFDDTKSIKEEINENSIQVSEGQRVYETSLNIPETIIPTTVDFEHIDVQYTITVTRKTFLSMLESHLKCPIIIGAVLT